jgi:hypothetical protein
MLHWAGSPVCGVFLLAMISALIYLLKLLQIPNPYGEATQTSWRHFSLLDKKIPNSHLQGETLTELCNPDGARLLPSAWKGTTLPSCSTLLWPRQAHPRSGLPGDKPSQLSSFMIWPPPTTVSNLVLCHHLGHWHPSHLDYRRWPFYQTDLYYLFIELARGYIEHSDTMQGWLPSCSFNASPCGRHHTLHTIHNAVPVKPSPARRNLISADVPIGYFRHANLVWTNLVPTTFQAHLHQLEPWEMSLF